MQDQRGNDGQTCPGEVSWRDDVVPVSLQFDDPYFSLAGGLEETRHVFLAGNDLPARFKGDFRIAELGFGTGLSFLVAWRAWAGSGRTGSLRFTSFEAFPMQTADMARALAAFPEVAPEAETLLSLIGNDGPHADGTFTASPGVTLEIVAGDARETLQRWEGSADAWFLDGFSPARNPELWESALLAEVARHTAPGGTAATYTAAGHVRRALGDAGFDVTRKTGFGRKRHMTTARLRDAE